MKRPSYDDLCKVRVELQLHARTLPDADATRLAIERLDAWLKAEADHALTREVKRCPFKVHRVRDVENQGDDIYVERCRCGAARVRDRRVGEVTDWRPARG